MRGSEQLALLRLLGRRVLFTLVGGLILAIGIVFVALPFIPGGTLLTIVGLVILAREWPWAQRLLDRARARLSRLMGRGPSTR